MRRTGLARFGGLTLSISYLCAAPAIAGNTPTLEGRWIGGFDNRGGVVAVDARITAGDAPSGTIALPQRAEAGIPLRNVSVRGRTMSFEVPGAEANLLFDGRFETDARIRGSVRQGLGYTRFELHKVASLPAADLADVYGTYVWGEDKVLLVAPGEEQPIYVDYDTGRTGALFTLSRDEFVAGPTMASGFPVALRVRPLREASGRVHALDLERHGRTVRATRRVFYEEVPVRVPGRDVSLGATLLLPSGPGPHPAIVMIHGSGPVTRDALRPFADHFARHGVAVLIADKRGTGASTGRWARATFSDLADDALAGVAYLKGRPDIQPHAIGLHGTSLGGWIAPLAATRSSDVAFVVVESAPVMTPREHERLRVETQMRADGHAPELIAQAVAFMDRKFDVARTGDGWGGLVVAMVAGQRAGWLPYVNPPSSLESLQWHWEHVFSHDPLPVLQQLTVPMLVLYGELDAIVPPRVHKARMLEALRATGRHNVTIREFARANHGFFEAITGGRLEQPRLTGFVAGYFEARTAWVRAQSRAAVVQAASADLQD